ncbi:MAG TPA: tetratricopeptide repeat protein [bacterium]|nr:tetratricopeptide repeat protein [bacterium]
MKTGGSIQANYTKVSLVEEADRLFEKGQYQTALLKYSGYVLSPYPNKDKRDLPYARYQMALCQFLLGQYTDARMTLSTLMKENPGQYRQEAK